MQTFLPYPDFVQSARCLDKRRVWKQTIEARQLLNSLAGHSKGWTNHPACRMWAGYADALFVYFHTCLCESIRRGIKVKAYRPQLKCPLQREVEEPPWIGDPAFHAAHRSNLLRKDPSWYGQFGWTEPNDLPYVWPV